MGRVETIISGIAHFLNELGYAVDFRDPCAPLHIHLVGWRDRKPFFLPLGRWQDVWVVSTIPVGPPDDVTERKKALQNLIGGEFSPKLLDVELKDPFINIVIVGEQIDPEKEVEAVAPDRGRHARSTFYTATAFDVGTQGISSAQTWMGSVASSGMQLGIAQILMGKSPSQQELSLLRTSLDMK